MSKVTIATDLDAGKIMMDGSSSRKSYMCLARRGDIALGIQFGGITSGPEGLMLVTCRLRSVEGAGKLFAKEDKVSAVTNLADTKATPGNAWGDIKWEKDHGYYASTTVFYHFKGEMETSEGKAAVLEVLKSGAVGRAIAKFLADTAGEEHLIQSQSDIAAWFNGKYTAFAEDMEKQLGMAADLKVEYAKLDGVVADTGRVRAIQSEVREKYYPKPEPTHQEAEDLPESDDTDESDEGDTEE